MKKLIGITALALCGVLLSAAPSAAAAQARAAGKDYDYSRPEDTASSSVDEVGLLERYLGAPLSETERAYLSTHGSFALRYSDAVGISNVVTDLSEESGLLSVSAKPLSYTAANGHGVVWKPVDVEGEPVLQSGDEYTWSHGVTEKSGDFITVGYETSFPVGAEDVNAALNRTYQAARLASEKLAEREAAYHAELEAYGHALDAHENYLAELEAYGQALAEYESYRAAYAEWSKKNSAHEQYLRDLAQYEADQAAYAQYEEDLKKYEANVKRYEDYLAAYADYEKQYAEYLASFTSEEAKTALRQIGYLDFMFAQTEREGEPPRTLYSAVMGNAVMTVLEYKDAILEVEPGLREPFVQAENATYALRGELLPMYFLCITNEAKYQYYISCQAELAKQLTLLLQALDNMYRLRVVKQEVDRNNRTWQFRILLAQLYYMCNLLTDGPVPDWWKAHSAFGVGEDFDESYRIDGYTPAELLKGTPIPEDIDGAEPLSTGYPNLPAEPTAPRTVPPPGARPTAPKTPVMPQTVEDPGPAPAPVEEPVRPQEVPMPEEPTPYFPTEEELALTDALARGTLEERPPCEADFPLTVRTEVIRYFRNAQTVVVRFYGEPYGESAGEPVYTVEADRFSYVGFPLPLPERTRVGYTCKFAYWEDREGSRVDLTRLDVDAGTLDLYPHFEETPNLYRIYWEVGSLRFSDFCAYDAVPVYDEARFAPLEKPEKDGRAYRFIGWNRGEKFFPLGEDLDTMTETAVLYSAVFEESLRAEWVVDGRTVRKTPVWSGDVPQFGEEPQKSADALYAYTFEGWALSEGGTAAELEPMTEDGRYYAVFSREFLVSAGGSGASVKLTDATYSANALSLGSGPIAFGGLVALADAAGAGISLRLAAGNLSLSADLVRELATDGAKTVQVRTVQLDADHFRFSVTFADMVGAEIVPQNVFTLEAYARFAAETSDLHLYRMEEGGAVECSFERSVGAATVTLLRISAGATYEMYALYSVGALSYDDAELSVSLSAARVGECVEVHAAVSLPGTYLAGLYYAYYDPAQPDENGAPSRVEVAIEGGAFLMPARSVTVGMTIGYYEYTVEFRSEGKTLSVRTYRYGEKVTVPAVDPVKSADEEFTYQFAGWDRAVEPVTGDAVYNAVFRASPLPPRAEQQHTKYYYLIRAVKIGLPVFLLCIVLLVVILVLCNRKKRKIPAQKGKKGNRRAR